MNAWIPNTITLQGLGTVPANQTDYVVSKKFPITAGGSQHIVISVAFTASAAGTYKAKLRSSLGINGTVDAKEVSLVVGGAGSQTIYIKLNNNASADQTYLPLLSLGEVVMSTPAGGTATSIVVQSLQEE